MNELQIFNKMFENKTVEIIKLKNEILFNARHVGLNLGIVQINSTLRSFDEDEKIVITNSIVNSYSTVHTIHSRKFHGNGELFLTESGLYKLIFISRIPRAKKFQKWVTSEVLPDIRKHGMYATQNTIDNMLEDPDRMISLLITYKKEKADRIEAQKQRDIAIATKAEIGNRREATAMATASVAVRRLNKANAELGRTKKYASILKVALTLGRSEKEFSWHKLKKITLELGMEVKRIPDPRFEYANTYPAKAWEIVYDIKLADIM